MKNYKGLSSKVKKLCSYNRMLYSNENKFTEPTCTSKNLKGIKDEQSKSQGVYNTVYGD